MDFIKQNAVPIIGGLLLLGGVYVYAAYFMKPTTATLTTTTNSTLSQQLLTTLQNLHTIKLDSSVFDDPGFKSLTDFGVTIPPEAVGRRNPFLPTNVTPVGIGLGSGASSGNASAGGVQIQLPKTK